MRPRMWCFVEYSRRHLTLIALCSGVQLLETPSHSFKFLSALIPETRSFTVLGSPTFTWFRFYSYILFLDIAPCQIRTFRTIAPLIFRLSFLTAPPTEALILPTIGSSNPKII